MRDNSMENSGNFMGNMRENTFKCHGKYQGSREFPMGISSPSAYFFLFPKIFQIPTIFHNRESSRTTRAGRCRASRRPCTRTSPARSSSFRVPWRAPRTRLSRTAPSLPRAGRPSCPPRCTSRRRATPTATSRHENATFFFVITNRIKS